MNWNNLPDVIAYCKKVGGMVIKVEGRPNYNIIPIPRPDLFLDENVQIVYKPSNAERIYTGFNFSKSRLLPLYDAGLKKLNGIRVID